MNDQPADPDGFRRLQDAQARVPEKTATESLTLPFLGDCKPCEDRDGNRVGHVAAEASGRDRERNRT